MSVSSRKDHIPGHGPVVVPDEDLGVLIRHSGDITQDIIHYVVPVVQAQHCRDVGELSGEYLGDYIYTLSLM